jgi:hypothetical protein
MSDKTKKGNPFDNVGELIAKVDDMKKLDKMDLSSDQDLSIAVMNLISIEEHLIFSGAKTGKTTYYDLVEEIRNTRKELLKMLIKEYEGEVWCISKHLLAASMRIMEVGTKQLQKGNKKEAYKFLDKSFELYSLFWGLNLKMINTSNIQSLQDPIVQTFLQKAKSDTSETVVVEDTQHSAEEVPKSFMGKLKAFVKNSLDCCIE